jgi:hypothetical protein
MDSSTGNTGEANVPVVTCPQRMEKAETSNFNNKIDSASSIIQVV